ncbi:MAG: NTP transferase domain-containing protein [Planctomycetes bacterium]|nr:NTP transferase domain-containing protein [Planctomycetota bacterium]
MSEPIAVVLAAGKGTRMESDLPKVLVEVCGRPMIHYVLDALAAGGIERFIVVVGYHADDVKRELSDRSAVSFALQEDQLGTGHAVMMAGDQLTGHDGAVMIVAGDSPMLQSDSVRALLAAFERDRPACLLGTAHKDDPTGLGRVVRDGEGNFVGIVEETDATAEQRRITEVNMSTYLFNAVDLLQALDQLHNDNVPGEYYITDCPGMLKAAGKDVQALDVLQPCEALSINNLAELAVVEEEIRNSYA